MVQSKKVKIYNVKKLKDCVSIKGRIGWKGLKKTEFGKDGVLIINGPEIFNGVVNWEKCLRVPEWRYNESPEIMVQEKNILMTKDGTIGKLAFVDKLPERATLASGVFRIESKTILPEFLFCYFQSKEFKELVISRTEGSVIPHLYQRDIEELAVPEPPIEEQKKIAEILFNLDSKVKLNQQMNRTLEALGEAVFKRWFVDFEFPNQEGKPYKSSGGEMEFSDELNSDIPKGWEVKSLDELAQFTRGFSYNGTEKSNSTGELVFITLNSIREGGGFKRKFSYLTSSRLKERHFVKEGDLIIANTHFGVGGSNEARILGTPALVEFPSNYNQQKGCFSHHITKITPKNTEMRFNLYYHLQHYQKKATEYKIGSFIWSLDVQGFAHNEKVSVPPQHLLELFSNFINTAFQRKQANNRQSETLSILRETLLPKLMSGKIRVPITEEKVEILGNA